MGVTGAAIGFSLEVGSTRESLTVAALGSETISSEDAGAATVGNNSVGFDSTGSSSLPIVELATYSGAGMRVPECFALLGPTPLERSLALGSNSSMNSAVSSTL